MGVEWFILQVTRFFGTFLPVGGRSIKYARYEMISTKRQKKVNKQEARPIGPPEKQRRSRGGGGGGFFGIFGG